VTILANTYDITRVTIENSDGDIRPLTGKTRADWDFHAPNWENESSGEPKEYAWDPSNSELLLRPKPDSSYVVTNGLKVWEVHPPTGFTSDSTFSFNDNSILQTLDMCLAHGVTALCWMDDGTPEALAKARFHRSNDSRNPGEYEKYLKMIASRMGTPSGVATQIKWYPQGARMGIGRGRTKEYFW